MATVGIKIVVGTISFKWNIFVCQKYLNVKNKILRRTQFNIVHSDCRWIFRFLKVFQSPVLFSTRETRIEFTAFTTQSMLLSF